MIAQKVTEMIKRLLDGAMALSLLLTSCVSEIDLPGYQSNQELMGGG